MSHNDLIEITPQDPEDKLPRHEVVPPEYFVQEKDSLIPSECSHCRNDSFRLYKYDNKANCIIVECTECLSTTSLEPTFMLEWHESSQGLLKFCFDKRQNDTGTEVDNDE